MLGSSNRPVSGSARMPGGPHRFLGLVEPTTEAVGVDLLFFGVVGFEEDMTVRGQKGRMGISMFELLEHAVPNV